MDAFRAKKIRKHIRKPLLPRIISYITQPKIALISGLIILSVFIVYGLLQFSLKLNFFSFASRFAGIFGRDVITDQLGNTNILLLGVGGKGHEGENLTDSILLFNINHDKKIVNIISIPRDIYIHEPSLGGIRINKIYETVFEKHGDSQKALEATRSTFSKVFDVNVPYITKIDFQGFEKAIDLLNGIDIYVPEVIDDPFFPKEGTYEYERFFLPSGNQHLDGKTALKYARSRKTSSDFDRGKRQQQVLMAIRKRAVEKAVLKNPQKLKAMYRAIADHFETNIDVRELLTLISLGQQFKDESVFHWSIHDDPLRAGYFLYTPVRELYGGAFVLLPASDSWNSVRKYFSFILRSGDILQQKTPIQILNGTKKTGLAFSVKSILEQYSFTVHQFGNARANNLKTTSIYYKTAEKPAIIDLLLELIPAYVTNILPEDYKKPDFKSDSMVMIELGEDFIPVFDKLDVFRNIVEIKKAQE